MVVASLIIKGLGVPDDAVYVDVKGLIRGQDLVSAYVSELGGAISVRRFHPDDLPVYPTLVHLPDVAGLRESRGIFVHVTDGDVDSCTERKRGIEMIYSFEFVYLTS